MMLLLEVISQHLDSYDVVVGGHFRPTTPPTTFINNDVVVGTNIYIFMMLLLEVISHQQHLQQQHLYIYDVVVGVLGGNLPTQVETFPPGFKPFHPGGNLHRWKPSHPGGNVYTQVEPFPPVLYTTSTYYIHHVHRVLMYGHT